MRRTDRESSGPFPETGLNGFFKDRDRVPVFVKLKDGSIEPVIMLSDAWLAHLTEPA